MAHALELSTQHERPSITIDGEKYALALMGELSIVQQKRVTNATDASGRIDDMTLEEAEALEDDLKVAVQPLVLGATDEVLSKLSDTQRLQIITAFFSEAAKLIQAANNKAAAPKSTSRRTSKSPRASKSSTADRPKSGRK